MLKWALCNGFDWDCDLRKWLANAGGDYLELLKWVRFNECTSDCRTCLSAAGGGHLMCCNYKL